MTTASPRPPDSSWTPPDRFPSFPSSKAAPCVFTRAAAFILPSPLLLIDRPIDRSIDRSPSPSRDPAGPDSLPLVPSFLLLRGCLGARTEADLAVVGPTAAL
mmetsp:Transcript_21775/g.68219  ORF Transcript_21775/g.68219 Transcript_21775/m.68219 type:complete len:102 (-) Transcript_21775:890-1195(-)